MIFSTLELSGHGEKKPTRPKKTPQKPPKPNKPEIIKYFSMTRRWLEFPSAKTVYGRNKSSGWLESSEHFISRFGFWAVACLFDKVL